MCRAPRPPRDTINVPPPPPQRSAYDFEVIIRNPTWHESKKKDFSHFVVMGTAENLKSGACVVSDGISYEIDGLAAWNEKHLRKRIRVEGEFIVELLGPKDSTQLPPYDYRLIIKNPKW